MNKFEPGACQRIQDQLDHYLSGEISPQAQDEISHHLDHCARCGAEFETFRQVRESLKGAVLRETVPPHLESKIRAAITRPKIERRSLWIWAPAFGLAASLVIAFFAGWLGPHEQPQPWEMAKADQQAYIDSLYQQVAAVIRVGLGDHVHCAYFRKPKDAATFEQMAGEMGPDYAPLIPIVKQEVPAEYRIVTAHRCSFRNRHFVHMVMEGEGKLLSLVITRREPGESFAGGNLAVVETVGNVPIYQASADRFEIAGFETGEHLAFIVSDLGQQENLAWAASLASPLHRFLTDSEG